MSNQDQQPAPQGGLGGLLSFVLSIVQAVTGLVPRWLVVAAGVVFLAWVGLDIYLNARERLARTETIELDNAAKHVSLPSMNSATPWVAKPREAPSAEDQAEIARIKKS
jgi:hypothetical protein